jgi:hypothetical protein
MLAHIGIVWLITALGAAGYSTPVPPGCVETPSMCETIDIEDFDVSTDNSRKVVTNVYFKLSGDNATALECSAANPDFPSKVHTCGDSKYRFALTPGSEWEFALMLYHELGPGQVDTSWNAAAPYELIVIQRFGFYGKGDVFTYCHAGGSGMRCSQQVPTSVIIDSLPDGG